MFKLTVDSVELEFNGRKILQDIYLDCSTGEVVGLLGRNGSGKSSLLKIIFGVLTPTHKYLSINEDVLDKGYHKNRVAYLPQHNYLPKGIPVSSLAKMLVATEYWNEFSNLEIYKIHHRKKTEQLSGGELRQLGMLMILYSRSYFILLDEPFTHVTPIQADYFKGIINTVAKNKGIIVTDHQYRNIMDVSDRLIVIADGCTKPITSTEDLVTYNYLSGNN
ncbi:ATP-binding cassette domain-containing protein [Mucilaginibacter ginsenosidivorans]|uniref:ATP-binding cassette domain-containing protein n=1 Tax=Mucilaginibacter ginsenosidivorans TaxID=398053 RepID=A0A5B8UXG5_9SPHI|nr:ATP-binding cassette domain-containing protein [Mucilaginibacter ginsenosidivorans]QEC63847.1 ATP-binding cassette domain-containing protein [Mucilaginibacter ginsenosidivorans]